MSYIGKVDMNDANIKHYSLTGSTLTVIPIGWIPASEQSLRVTINGVVQQGDTFSYSGSNLTLGGPLVVTDTLEVVGIESVGNIITPADNSVTTTKLADDAVTLAKMAGLVRGKIIVGDASGDPSALTVGGASTVLTSDGTDAAWGASYTNPNTLSGCSVYLGSAQTTATGSYTKVALDTEVYDIANEFASNKFTVTTAGKYLIIWSVSIADLTDACAMQCIIRNNGSTIAFTRNNNGRLDHLTTVCTIITDLSASDYIEGFVFQNGGATESITTGADSDTFMQIMRMT